MFQLGSSVTYRFDVRRICGQSGDQLARSMSWIIEIGGILIEHVAERKNTESHGQIFRNYRKHHWLKTKVVVKNSEIVQTYTNVLGHPCAETKRNEHNHGMNLKEFVWRTALSKIPYHFIHECESVWSSFEAFEGVTENQSDRGEFETTDSSEDLKKYLFN